MKKIFLTFVILFAVALSWAQQTPITKANYQLAARFSPKKVDKLVLFTQVMPNWFKHSDKFWYVWRSSKGTSYYIVDPNTGQKRAIFDNAKLAAQLTEIVKDPFDAQHLPINALRLKDDNTFTFSVISTALEENIEPKNKEPKNKKGSVKRKSKPVQKGRKTYYFNYDIKTNTLTELEENDPLNLYPSWGSVSPDKKHVIYSKGFNLWYMDMENFKKANTNAKDTTIVETQLTTEGTSDFSFGEVNKNLEELEKDKDKRKNANIAWSPDSKNIAFIRTNTENVKDLWVINSLANPRPTLERYKYQMPGETGAPIKHLYVYNLENKQMKEIDVSAFKDQQLSLIKKEESIRETMYDTIKHRVWEGDANELFVIRTSRDLKRVDLCAIDLVTDTVKPIIKERMNTYVETRDPKFVGDKIIWWSERSGWAHLYLYNTKGNLINQITSGEFHVEEVVAVDKKQKVIYFTANGREEGENPYFTHHYRVNFDGSNLKLLNPGNYNHTVTSSETGKYFINNYSRVDKAPKSSLIDNNGKTILNLEETDLSQLFDMGYKFPEPFTVKAADGVTDLYGVMYKPFDFDSTKLYPIIEYVYPGPQTEAVNTFWSSRMDRVDRLAQLGFIVITVGNRGGHPARSKWYHNYGYGNLRDYGLEDKKVVIEKLAAKYNFIDINKVGIHGHSGGGFMSTAAMLVYPDFFKVAVSCAGNHENNIYNRWWSEKHHGVLEQVSAKGDTTFKYSIDKNSQIAKNLKGHLLLVTGDIDNNVHPANTLRMADALIKANKRFDMLMLPGRRHSFGTMTEYFFWRMADYFSEHLIGDHRDEVEIPQMNNN